MISAGESAGIVDALWAFVQEYPDPVAFGLLLLCGIGLPMPEEPILLMVGAVVVKLTSGGHAGGIGIQLLRMTAVCAAGILAGDVLCFHLGRKVGREVFRFRIVRAIATRPRRIRAERFFHRYGPWAIFMARFFAGVRIVMFFGAGMSHRVSYLRFVLMDFLGVLVSVPISIWIGFVVVRELSDLKDWASAGEKLGHFHLILVAAAVAGIAVWIVLARKRRAADREEQRTGVVD